MLAVEFVWKFSEKVVNAFKSSPKYSDSNVTLATHSQRFSY
jgi:hypothetical protein